MSNFEVSLLNLIRTLVDTIDSELHECFKYKPTETKDNVD